MVKMQFGGLLAWSSLGEIEWKNVDIKNYATTDFSKQDDQHVNIIKKIYKTYI